MSKAQKKEKFALRVIDGGLALADSWSANRFAEKKYKSGDLLFATLTKPRTQSLNRQAHLVAQLCSDNLDAFKGMDAHRVLKRLQLESGAACYSIGIKVPGFGMVEQRIPLSLSFDSMDEGEFHEAVKQICRHIAAEYWIGVEPIQIENMSKAMISE